MRHKEQRKNDAAVVVNTGDQSKFIAGDVKHSDGLVAADFYAVGMRIIGPHMHEIAPVRTLGGFDPSF